MGIPDLKEAWLQHRLLLQMRYKIYDKNICYINIVCNWRDLDWHQARLRIVSTQWIEGTELYKQTLGAFFPLYRKVSLPRLILLVMI